MATEKNPNLTDSERMTRLIAELREFYDIGAGSTGLLNQLSNQSTFSVKFDKDSAIQITSEDSATIQKATNAIPADSQLRNLGMPAGEFYLRKAIRKQVMPQEVLPHPFSLGFLLPSHEALGALAAYNSEKGVMHVLTSQPVHLVSNPARQIVDQTFNGSGHEKSYAGVVAAGQANNALVLSKNPDQATYPGREGDKVDGKPVKLLSDLSYALNQRFRKKAPDTGLMSFASINQFITDLDPAKNAPAVSSVLIFPSNSQMKAATEEVVSLFSNVCTTLQMSQAAPYLDVEVFTNAPDIADDEAANRKTKGRPFSVYRFLNMELSDDPNSQAVFATAQSSPGAAESDGTEKSPEATRKYQRDSGMEVFLSPQTMTNPEGQGMPGKDPNSPHDPFRPFLSILSFNSVVQPIGGASAEKTATLTIKLHDKSRMGEIAPLISPDGHGLVRLKIRYGWQHPGGKQVSDPIGRLIDAMQVEEYYQVVTSSFNIQGSEVEITMELFTVSSKSIAKTDVVLAMFDNVLDIQDIQDDLNFVKTKIAIFANQKYGDLKIPSVLFGGKVEDVFDLSKEDMTEILSARTKLLNAGRSDLHKVLGELFGTVAKKTRKTKASALGAIRQAKATRIQKMNERLAELNCDPYLPSSHLAYISPGNNKYTLKDTVDFRGLIGFYRLGVKCLDLTKEVGSKKIATDGLISLGYLLTAFMGPALTGGALTGTNVTFVFECANDSAGAHFENNIAEFPLCRSRVKKVLGKLFSENARVSPRMFFQVVADQLVAPQSAYGYGLHNHQANEKTSDANRGKLAAKRENLLKEFYLSGNVGAAKTKITGQRKTISRDLKASRDMVGIILASETFRRELATEYPATEGLVDIFDTSATEEDRKTHLAQSYGNENTVIYQKASGKGKKRVPELRGCIVPFGPYAFDFTTGTVQSKDGDTIEQFEPKIRGKFVEYNPLLKSHRALFSKHSFRLANQVARDMNADLDEEAQSRLSLLEFVPEFCPMQLVMSIESGPTQRFKTDGTEYVDHTVDTIRVKITDQAHDPFRQAKAILDGLSTQTKNFEEILRIPDGSKHSKFHRPNHFINNRHVIRDLQTKFKIDIKSKLLGDEGQGSTGRLKRVLSVRTSIDKLKKTLSTVYPTLNYGSDSSSIVSADLGINGDSELLSVRLSEGVEEGEYRPPADLPLLVVPSDLSLEMFGCPFVGFMQKYFIDFKTNTSLDSFYAVISAEHSVEPGKFMTSLNLTPMDSYGRYVPPQKLAGAAAMGDAKYRVLDEKAVSGEAAEAGG